MPFSRGFYWLVVLLLALIIVPFLIWGAHFDAVFSLEGARTWMLGHGTWAWMAGMALIAADIVLPIPATVVMSALGLIYGWWWGGLAAAAGSMLAGCVAYGLCRGFGRGAARWIAGEEGLKKGEALFSTGGGWIVALSRWTPVLPEAVACLAGIVRMPWRTFVIALACGSVPLGFAFAAIGYLGQASPALAIALSAVVPVLLWFTAAKLLKRGKSEKGG
jgi:uncharacterized membrane protein YdjX (TVP38/TMEM64 family)